jgi:hypothetical protein
MKNCVGRVMQMKRMAGKNLAFFLMLLAGPLRPETHISVISDLENEKTSSPGSMITGNIVVKNMGTDAEEIRVYQTDFRQDMRGRSTYGEAGRMNRSNAGWIEFSPVQTSVPPGETIIIQYSVSVPDSVSLPGSYWSLIMVEPVENPITSQSRPEKSVSIKMKTRYANLIITNIEDSSGSRRIRFTNIEMDRTEGKARLNIDLENTGDYVLRPTINVTLFDESGHEFTPPKASVKRILPGMEVRCSIDMAGIPEGSYQAVIAADCGGEDIFGINQVLKVQ